MKRIIPSLLILIPLLVNAQKNAFPENLLNGQAIKYQELPFKAQFQKVQIFEGNIHCTVLDLKNDMQIYVIYRPGDEAFVPFYIGQAGTFYAGNGMAGHIVPGGTANIKGVQNLSNERDIIRTPDQHIYFTSDAEGLFQLYSQEKNKAKKIELKELNQHQIINLWNNNSSIYFDAVSYQTGQTKSYMYEQNQLTEIEFHARSISFTDNLLVYIEKDSMKILSTSPENSVIQFVFFFLNDDYEEAVSLTKAEADYLSIDSNAIIDGVIEKQALEHLKTKLKESETPLPLERKDYLQAKITQENSEIVSFIFFFLNDDYEDALSLTNAEANYLQIDSSAIIDGVIQKQALQQLETKLQENEQTFFSNKRKEQIQAIIANNNGEIVSFVFFFLDDDYENAASITAAEATYLGIDEFAVEDGVLKPEIKEKALAKLQADENYFATDRKLLLTNTLNPPNNDELVAFYGFFVDTANWITETEAAEETNNMGLISINELMEYIENTEDDDKKQELTKILIQRSWDENISLEITDTITVQIGAYLNNHTDFAYYLFEKSKINVRDYQYLKSLNIFCINAKGLYLYRTKVPANELLKIKKTMYFDKPFIVNNFNN